MPNLEDNEVECARCGGTFHISLSRCPHCGVNLYEPQEEQNPQISALDNIKNTLRFPLAILAGWFIAAFIGLLIYIPLRTAQATTPASAFVAISAALTLGLGAFAGGFLYQRISQTQSTGGTISQIAFSSLLGVLVFLTENTLWTLFAPLSLLAIASASFYGIKLADKMLRQALIDDLFAPVVRSQERYEDLLAKVGHDRDVAERLLAHERVITPKATRDILVENAIKRWEKDNRVR